MDAIGHKMKRSSKRRNPPLSTILTSTQFTAHACSMSASNWSISCCLLNAASRWARLKGGIKVSDILIFCTAVPFSVPLSAHRSMFIACVATLVARWPDDAGAGGTTARRRCRWRAEGRLVEGTTRPALTLIAAAIVLLSPRAERNGAANWDRENNWSDTGS